MVILAVDIGNTNIKTAFVEDYNLIDTIAVATDNFKTNNAKDYLLSVSERINNYKPQGLIISSVVKGQGEKYADFFKKFGLNKPVFVSGDLQYRYRFPDKYKNEIGGDILATTAACDAFYGDCILVDTGTAITFQVLENHIFRGGIICAGINMMAKALKEGTSLLPAVAPEIPDELLSFDTVKCIQSGLMYGQAAMIDGMLERIEKHFGKKFTTVATGGDTAKISSLIKKPFDKIENDLIFKGLNVIYNDNCFNV
jgi:type III pantothenate kinase